jgi:phage virion morphogenesis protein
VSFEITIEADHLIRALDKARHKIGSNAVLTSIGLSLLKANDKRHKAGQAPDGSPWKPLKPATIREKCKKSRSIDYKMLFEHGDMLRFYSRVDSDAVVIGTADKKAYWHHAGTIHKPPRWLVMAGKKNYLEHSKTGLPARPLVGFAEADQRLVKDLIEDHLQVILRSVR